jgi:hypothetical protein
MDAHNLYWRIRIFGASLVGIFRTIVRLMAVRGNTPNHVGERAEQSI